MKEAANRFISRINDLSQAHRASAFRILRLLLSYPELVDDIHDGSKIKEALEGLSFSKATINTSLYTFNKCLKDVFASNFDEAKQAVRYIIEHSDDYKLSPIGQKRHTEKKTVDKRKSKVKEIKTDDVKSQEVINGVLIEDEVEEEVSQQIRQSTDIEQDKDKDDEQSSEVEDFTLDVANQIIRFGYINIIFTDEKTAAHLDNDNVHVVFSKTILDEALADIPVLWKRFIASLSDINNKVLIALLVYCLYKAQCLPHTPQDINLEELWKDISEQLKSVAILKYTNTDLFADFCVCLAFELNKIFGQTLSRDVIMREIDKDEEIDALVNDALQRIDDTTTGKFYTIRKFIERLISEIPEINDNEIDLVVDREKAQVIIKGLQLNQINTLLRLMTIAQESNVIFSLSKDMNELVVSQRKRNTEIM